MENEFAAFVAIDWADQNTSGQWKHRMHQAGNRGVWIIRRNRWTSGLPSSGCAFRASRWRWHWNNLVGR